MINDIIINYDVHWPYGYMLVINKNRYLPHNIRVPGDWRDYNNFTLVMMCAGIDGEGCAFCISSNRTVSEIPSVFHSLRLFSFGRFSIHFSYRIIRVKRENIVRGKKTILFFRYIILLTPFAKNDAHIKRVFNNVMEHYTLFLL